MRGASKLAPPDRAARFKPGRRLRWLAAAGLCLAAPAARAESVLFQLSTDEVLIHESFVGTTISVFGVVERDRQTVSRAGNYEIAVTVAGPRRRFLVQRKERVAGVWMNVAGARFWNVPSFYAVNTSAPLSELAHPRIVDELAIGLDYVGRPGSSPLSDKREEFRGALVRLKQAQGFYHEELHGVTWLSPSFFATRFDLPGSVESGLYEIEVQLFAAGTHLATSIQTLRVAKAGFEQSLFDISRERPLVYGLSAVLLAIATGYVGSVVFRRT